MEFAKLHALGNDFLIMRVDEAGGLGVSLADLARRVCERRRGVGADGVLFFQPTIGDEASDFAALIFNADGGKAEMSGNGIRCLAAFLIHTQRRAKASVRIRTVAGIRNCVLKSERGGVYGFEVSMGFPITEAVRIPVRLGTGAEPLLEVPFLIGREAIRATILSMGNPHCSTFWPEVDRAPVESVGPALENHAAFPRRTNVEFVQVLEPHRLRVRFWERGVGRTMASGTGSCAAAVAAILRRQASSPVAVETEGGELLVRWQPSEEVFLTGTAELICSGELAHQLAQTEAS